MNDFEVFWRILCEAFPECEHRRRESHEALLKHPRYRLNFIREEERILGFWSLWDLGEFRYMEHLALDSSCRGKGYGSKVFEQVFQDAELPFILEVERPDTDKARRRIALYQRLGLHLNRFDYHQPPLQPGCREIPMYLMSWPEPLDEAGFNGIRDKLYETVYSTATL